MNAMGFLAKNWAYNCLSKMKHGYLHSTLLHSPHCAGALGSSLEYSKYEKNFEIHCSWILC